MWIYLLRIAQSLQKLTGDGVAIHSQCSEIPLPGKGSMERAVVGTVQNVAALALRPMPRTASSPVFLCRIAATLPHPLTSTKALVSDIHAHAAEELRAKKHGARS